jgi:hypothetical protein
MNRRFTVALISALLLSPTAFAKDKAKKAKGSCEVTPNEKQLVVKGPVHVNKIVTNGTGTVSIFEVQSENASNAGCAAAQPVAGGAAETFNNNGNKGVSLDVPEGRLLCATLTAGTKIKVSWEGTDVMGGGAHGTSGHDGALQLPLNQPHMMLAGPADFEHFSTGGDGAIEVYLADKKTGTDADCVAEAATAKAAQTLAPRVTKKLNLQVPAEKVACAKVTSGTEAKIEWKAK